ncbi:hypothetical protein T484DRAFT_1817983, partial [Baffinella frigidus]
MILPLHDAQAAMLPGSSVEDTDLVSELDRPDSSYASSLCVSMRGAVLAPLFQESNMAPPVSIPGAVLAPVIIPGAVLAPVMSTSIDSQRSQRSFSPGFDGRPPRTRRASTEEESPPSRLRRRNTMRGAALAPDSSGNTAIVAHPTGGDIQELPQNTFSLRGSLMHAFVSYRASTEGIEGNGMSGLLAEKIRALSMDSTQELKIPRHGWGIWPKGVQQRESGRKEEAKVFLDRDSLQDGQSWLAGFVKGLVASMVVVPLLSWTEDDKGSVGEMSRIGVGGFDRVDNV